MLAEISSANADFIGDLGDVISFKVLPIYSATLTVYNSKWKKWYDYDWNGLKEIIVVNLVNSAVTDGIKNHVKEMRPNKQGRDSFPSGHTSNAFANAAFIHRRYGIKQAIIPYVFATFVGFSRIESHWHYTHDVLAGAAIGFLSAWIFASPQKQLFVSVDSGGAKIDFAVKF